MGNQPDIHVPYLYCYLGQPWKTQKLVQDILTQSTINNYGTHSKWENPYVGKIFKTTPDGYLKEMDDDAGTMSSWFVLSSIGVFPVCPGTPYFWIIPPLFESISISLPESKTFNIKIVRQTPKDNCVESVSLNGKEKSECFLTYQEIMAGGELVFKLGAQPNSHWGTIPPLY